jgi:hypothetical protein
VNNHTSDVEDVIIQGLANQERRKILKIIKLAKDGAIYSDVLAELDVNSGSLNYHLRQLEGLITKNVQGRYFLTPLGEKALKGLYSMTENLENGYEEYLNKAKTRQHRTIFPKLSGILTIIASCISCVYGIIMSLVIISCFLSSLYPTGFISFVLWVFNVLFGYVGFAFGLTAGMHLLKRMHFAFSLRSICFLLISSLLFIFTSSTSLQSGHIGMLLAFYMGLPLLVLSVLSIIFTSIAKREFI